MPDSSPTKELVFLYGHQWRDGLLVGKLNDAEIFGGGWVAGRLLSIGEHPVMVAEENAGTVRGEVYQVSQEHLEELDRIMETVATMVDNGRCRRVRVVAREVKLNAPPMEVWTWQWNDIVGQHPPVTSGDWLNPGLAPLFTLVALCCLLSGPVLVVAVTLAAYPRRSRGGVVLPPWASWTAMVLCLCAPLAGFYASYLAHRRKERGSGCLLLIVLGLAGLLLIYGMSLSKAFL